MSLPQMRPLGFGEILDGSFSLYRRHFLTLFLTTLLAFIPIALASWMMTRQSLAVVAGDAAGLETVGGFAIFGLVSALGFLLLWAVVTRQLSRALTGGRVDLADAFGAGVRAFFPLLGAALLAFLAFFVLAIVVAMAIGIAGMIGARFLGAAGSETAAGVFSVAMAILFVVLGFGALAALFAVVPAVVVEGKGPWAALKRSWQLSRGARLRIVGVVMVGYLIVFLPMLGVMLATGMTSTMWNPAAGAMLSSRQLAFQQVAGLLSGALTFPFFIGCFVLLYYDRRVRTEALDLEMAAEGLALAT
jgi:hypothetical protein